MLSLNCLINSYFENEFSTRVVFNYIFSTRRLLQLPALFCPICSVSNLSLLLPGATKVSFWFWYNWGFYRHISLVYLCFVYLICIDGPWSFNMRSIGNVGMIPSTNSWFMIQMFMLGGKKCSWVKPDSCWPLRIWYHAFSEHKAICTKQKN